MLEAGEKKDESKEVAGLCIEFWKLANGAKKAIDLLPEADGKRLTAQIKYSEKQLETLSQQMGLRLVELVGEEFHAGVAASADNADDFEDGTTLVVTKTLEPAVIQNMRVIRAGRVLVGPSSSSPKE